MRVIRAGGGGGSPTGVRISLYARVWHVVGGAVMWGKSGRGPVKFSFTLAAATRVVGKPEVKCVGNTVAVVWRKFSAFSWQEKKKKKSSVYHRGRWPRIGRRGECVMAGQVIWDSYGKLEYWNLFVQKQPMQLELGEPQH